MDVLHRPRRWVYSAASVALLVTIWLVFVPVTVVYVVSDDRPAPHDIAIRYSWWTTEQNLVYTDTGTNRIHLVNGIRLDCSTLLRIGGHEPARAPAGPRACAEVETPRLVAAAALFVFGMFGLLGARHLPRVSERYRNHYRQPYSQRRALGRGGR